MALRFQTVLLIACLLVFGPCLPAKAGETPPLAVLVSIAPQKYMLERIAGEAIAVTVLVKSGADPHTYEPSVSQMRAAANAQVWFTIGVPFEDVWLDRITGAAPKLAVVSCIKNIKRLSFSDDGLLLADFALRRGMGQNNGSLPVDGKPQEKEQHGAHETHGKTEDPHVWLSPMLVREMLPVMTRELCRLLPDKAPLFRKNARAFADELALLDQKLAERFNAIPAERRVFLTAHPSWRYFAHNYGLTVFSIEVDGKEPGPKSLKAITEAARHYGINTVFIEPQFPKNTAAAVAAALGAELVTADPLEEDLVRLYESAAAKLISAMTGKAPAP